MPRHISILFFVLIVSSCTDEAYRNEMGTFHFEQNKKFKDPERSPLPLDEVQSFSKLPYFTVDKDYRIEAEFVRTPNEEPFEMATTTERRPMYVKFGEAHFELNGHELTLEVYQDLDLVKQAQYHDYLFIPFTDLTNGESTYGGGRYIDLKIPKSDEIVIDFNKSYNPYCAYNSKYSCPIPPAANHLPIQIVAGVKAPDNHH